MDPKEMTRRVLRELAAERASHGHGEAERIDRRMHKSKGYLGRLIRGDLGLHVETLFEALEALDVDAADFFTRVVGTKVCPERLLRRLERQAEKGGRSVLDGFAIEIFPEVVDGRRFEVRLGFEEPPEVEDVSGQLEKFDEELFSFPDRALKSAEKLVLATIFELAEDPGGGNLAHACRALGALASSYRVCADFGLAARCLGLGFRLCSTADLPAVRAELLLRACYLVGDHSEYEIAIDLARRASDTYLLLQDETGLGKAFVVRAIMLDRAGFDTQAAEAYLLGLNHLAENVWIGRYSCFVGLALVSNRRGLLEEAEGWILKASKAHTGPRGANWLRLLWLKGDLALERGDLQSAEQLLCDARHGFAEAGNPFDVALVSLRLAKTLFLSGKLQEMRTLASEMLCLLKPLEKHGIAGGAVYDFTRAALTGEMTKDILDGIQKRVENDAPRVGASPHL